jgi:IS5 family transposase
MRTLIDFGVDELYGHVSKLGDRLARVKELINWEKFRPILVGLYKNHTEKGGRPNLDELVMLRALVLQDWYGLSDQNLNSSWQIESLSSILWESLSQFQTSQLCGDSGKD